MDCSFDVPTPSCTCQSNRNFRCKVPGVRCRDNSLRGRCWMKVQWHLKCFGTLQNGPEEAVVQVAPLNMTIDQCALEPVVMDCAFQLVSGCVRRGSWQRSEPGKTRRML